MTPFYFDIETIPCQDQAVIEDIAKSITAPAQYKKPDSIAEWLRENREAEAERQWLATSFDGGLGQVCVIAWAIGNGAVSVRSVADLSAEAERELLREFFAGVTGAGATVQFVGHNLIAFDLRFIWQRAMVLGVKPPFWLPRDPKPWSEAVFDTMLAWAGARERISMDRLCGVFGLPGKGDMDGSQVWPLVRDERIAEVADYCAADVERTRALHRRMTFAPMEG